MGTAELKAKLRELQEQRTQLDHNLETKRSALVEAATADESDKVDGLEEEVRNAETDIANLEKRMNTIQAEIQRRERIAAEEAGAQSGLESQTIRTIETGGADMEKRAAANFIRSAFGVEELTEETRATFATTGAGGNITGTNLLPTNMVNSLITEPLTKNQFREVVPISNIKGLEMPRIAYTIDDDGFVTDDQTAKELALAGDKVQFGRFKAKIFTTISDSVMTGSDIGLTNYVENALQSGLAAKEKKCMLAATPKVGEEHMSFYKKTGETYDVKAVTGSSMFDAITNAIADLHEDYRDNASVMMRYADYVAIVKELSNGASTLYGAQPEQVIGKPVIFCDSATTPIVGDFNYCRINYDGEATYDTDKDVKKGEYIFVLTAWLDIQMLLKSAFRLATVTP